jgi:hypothetical protein
MAPEDPRNARTVQPSPCRISSASGPANQWTSLSSRPCLPLCWRRCKWQGPFAPRTLLRFIASTDPSATLSSSADFPVSPVYGLPCSDDFAPGRGGLLQLLSMSLSPCCRFHPAEVNIRIGQSSAAHAAFALRLKARPSGILIFEATMRSLLLRPGDS